MTSSKATLLGFLAAALFPALVMAVVWPLTDRHDFMSGAISFLLYCPYAAMAVAFLGGPPYVVLLKWHLVRWWSAGGWGLLAGTISGVVFGTGIDPLRLWPFSLLGGASGLVFWAIWRTGNR